MVGQALTSVAIIGGGPGGLGTAIALSQLPFLKVTLYEKNPEPREAGAGISLTTNAWKVLDLLGASEGVKGGSKSNTHQRNAYTGKVLSVVENPENSQGQSRGAIRARRTRLQSALLAQVPEGIIQYSRKLVALENLPGQSTRLIFDDQTEAIAHLVVGADGLHSIIRKTLFKDHELRFTGNSAFRVLVPKSRLAHIPDITSTTSWWWGEDGHVYLSDVDEEGENDHPLFEITKFDQRLRDAVSAVQEGEWREFATFAGPRLDKITGWKKIALIGDASHPLSGAFGSGATFAMEDGWILARALELTQQSSHPVQDALKIFDQIRSPYYSKMYHHLDETKAKLQASKAETDSFDAFLQNKIDTFLYGDKDFIYKNDIQKVWTDYVIEHGYLT
ncbi:Salicylate hydroxylase [Penicillium brevicompactum]